MTNPILILNKCVNSELNNIMHAHFSIVIKSSTTLKKGATKTSTTTEQHHKLTKANEAVTTKLNLPVYSYPTQQKAPKHKQPLHRTKPQDPLEKKYIYMRH